MIDLISMYSVKNKLPADGEIVDSYNVNTKIRKNASYCYTTKTWCYEGEFIGWRSVTHWSPLSKI